MRRLLTFLLVSGCVQHEGCALHFPDASVTPHCLTEAERDHSCEVTIEGQVLDLVTLQPFPGRPTLSQTTAFDVDGDFPVGCPPLATVVPEADGRFGLAHASCRSNESSPVLLLTVEGGFPDPRAPTAWDRRLLCGGDGRCSPVTAEIWAPSQAVVAAWRQEFGGSPTRGLAVLLYNESDGRAAAGVLPTSFNGEPISARFLADDRRTLLPPETRLTGGSGIAIVGEVEPAVGGIRNRDYWRPTGLLFADNWVFMESLDLTPPLGQ
jgi:hypothetical protein